MPAFAVLLAQVTNAANAAVTDAVAADPAAADAGRPAWTMIAFYAVIFAMVYFLFFRPQSLAKKKQEETIKAAKTGDRVVTTGGIHGVIANVKETTVILKVADNVKFEIEKNHIEKVTRDAAPAEADKTLTAKAS